MPEPPAPEEQEVDLVSGQGVLLAPKEVCTWLVQEGEWQEASRHPGPPLNQPWVGSCLLCDPSATPGVMVSLGQAAALC